MSLGQRALITCPPAFAYGNQAVGGIIPANSTLIFDVELISFKWSYDSYDLRRFNFKKLLSYQ